MPNTVDYWPAAYATDYVPAAGALTLGTSGNIDTEAATPIGSTSNPYINALYDATGSSTGAPAYIITLNNRWPDIQTAQFTLERAGVTVTTALIIDSIVGRVVTLQAIQDAGSASIALATADKIHCLLFTFEQLVPAV